MIIIDTNILSELMAPDPDQKVVGWFGKQASRNIYTTAITTAEIYSGIAQLPDGRRRSGLEARFSSVLERAFPEHILDFSFEDSRYFGSVVAHRKAQGRPISLADALIAAIAKRCEASIATRNVGDFENVGLSLINPFMT